MDEREVDNHQKEGKLGQQRNSTTPTEEAMSIQQIRPQIQDARVQ